MIEDPVETPRLGETTILRSPWSLWDAVRSRWLIVVAAVVICGAAGFAYASKRTPTYTATATLSVLHLNFGVPGALSGFSTAAAALADTYARAIVADGVTEPLATEFHSTVPAMRSKLSAVAVPNSPIFTVTATTSSGAEAVKLANAAAAQLETYVQEINGASPYSAKLLGQLSRAEAAAAAKQQVVVGLRASQSQSAHASLSSSDRAALAAAQAAANTAQDQVNALKNAYQQTVVGTSAPQVLQPLEAALNSSNDRKSRMELYLFAGVVVGFAIGVGLAGLLYERRRGVVSQRRFLRG